MALEGGSRLIVQAAANAQKGADWLTVGIVALTVVQIVMGF